MRKNEKRGPKEIPCNRRERRFLFFKEKSKKILRQEVAEEGFIFIDLIKILLQWDLVIDQFFYISI